MEEFKRTGNTLEKLRCAPFGLLIVRPQHCADFGHRGEAVFHRCRVALRFPWITPRPVDADAAFARRVFAGDVVLIVGARVCLCIHGRFPCSFQTLRIAANCSVLDWLANSPSD